MRQVGFSTGALAKGDFRRGIDLQRGKDVTAIELSALRECELKQLLVSFASLDLDGFEYVSFHAPSQLKILSEAEAVQQIRDYLPRSVPVIIHPDVLSDDAAWQTLGSQLCLENMDRRKTTGRTLAEMHRCFERFPDASFCFDIAHARNVDSSMTLAAGLLWELRDRLCQVHISEVDANGQHRSIGENATTAYRRINSLIPESVPLIIESVIDAERMNAELATVRQCMIAGPRLSEQFVQRA